VGFCLRNPDSTSVGSERPPSGSPGHPASFGQIGEGTVTKHKEVTTLLWMIHIVGGERRDQGNRGIGA